MIERLSLRMKYNYVKINYNPNIVFYNSHILLIKHVIGFYEINFMNSNDVFIDQYFNKDR